MCSSDFVFTLFLSGDVTHVIVGCEEDRHVCMRTAKFMMGVVAGKWILSQQCK